MTQASRPSGASFRQALALLFMPSRRQAEFDVLAPRMRLALSLPLAATGLACIVVAVAACLSLAVLVAPPKPKVVQTVSAGGVSAPAEGLPPGLAEPPAEELAPGLGVPGLAAPAEVDEDAPTTSAAADAFWAHRLFTTEKLRERDIDSGVPFTYVANVLCAVQAVGGLILLAGAALAWRRRDGALNRVRKFYVAAYLIPLLGFYVVVEAMNVLLLGPLMPVSGPDGIEFVRQGSVVLSGNHFLSNWWIVPIKVGLIVGLLVAETLLVAAHLLARSHEAADLYKSPRVPKQDLGILYAGTGKDRRVWSSRFQSLGVHAVVILVLPWLLIFGAWTSTLPPYVIPGGDGGGGPIEVIKPKVVKKKPKRKLHYLANVSAAISFYQPDMEKDSEVQKWVEQETSVQYVAGAGTGTFGGRGKGTKAGWGGGGADGEIRFIRLEHGGKDWDDGMTTEKGRSDQNLLEYIHDTTGFKIRSPESIPISSLKLYKKGQAPPFVFFTGKNISITTSDRATLRKYCMDGGLIFVSSGGGSFDGEFKRLMQDIFPDGPLSDIPNDDLIFREPYVFPDGAPAFWHHGGNRALGVRAPGTSRLCVFYHPGDIHDAWKSGHSGLSSDKVASAFKLGINVISYAFTSYLDMHAPG